MNWKEYEREVRTWLQSNKITIPLTFFEDGILSADTSVYANSSFRPLFLLREVHDNESIDTYKKLIELEEVKQSTNLWGKVAELARRAKTELSDDSKTDDNSLKKVAVVNLKKVSGGQYANEKKSMSSISYELHAEMFSCYIQKQIESIKPTIIFCGGTFAELKNLSFGVTNLKEVNDFSEFNLRGLRKAYIGTLNNEQITVIDMWHPSASISYDDFSTGMEHLNKG